MQEIQSKVFICYSIDSFSLTRELGAQMTHVRERDFSVFWDERKKTGDYWDNTIERELYAADAFVLLISRGFFEPDSYVQHKEMPIVKTRHLADKVRIIPVLAEAEAIKDYNASWLKEIDIYPFRGMETIKDLSKEAIHQWLKDLDIGPVSNRIQTELMESTRKSIARNPREGLRFPDGSKKVLARAAHEAISPAMIDALPRLTFLTGEAGVGKSFELRRIAAQLAEERRDVLYLDARELVDVTSTSDFLQRIQVSALEDTFLSALDRIGDVVVLLDSLDVVTWRPRTFGFFLSLIGSLLSIPDVRIIAAIREFDIGYNAELSSMAHHAKIIKLERIAPIEVESAFRGAKIELPPDTTDRQKALDFFSLPLYLTMLLMLNREGPSPLSLLSEATALYSQVWREKVSGKNRILDQNCSPQDRKELAFLISDLSILRNELIVPLREVEEHENYREAADNILLSEGFIIGDHGRGFFHQTVLDYVTVYRLTESGVAPLQFAKEHEASFFCPPVLRAHLSFLRAESLRLKNDSYLDALRSLLKSKEIGRIWRLTTISFFARVTDPTDSEIALLNEYFLDSDSLISPFFKEISLGWLEVLPGTSYPTDEWTYYQILYALERNLQRITPTSRALEWIDILLRSDSVLVIGELRRVLLHLSDDHLLRAWPRFQSALINHTKDRPYFLHREDGELISRLANISPESVIPFLQSSDHHSYTNSEDIRETVLRILVANPMLLEELIPYIEGLYKAELNLLNALDQGGINTASESEPPDRSNERAPRIDRISLTYHIDKRTYYPNPQEKDQYWSLLLERAVYRIASSSPAVFPNIYEYLKARPYLNLKRIANRGAWHFPSKPLWLDFYTDPELFHLPFIQEDIIEALIQNAERVQPTTWEKVETGLIACIEHIEKRDTKSQSWIDDICIRLSPLMKSRDLGTDLRDRISEAFDRRPNAFAAYQQLDQDSKDYPSKAESALLGRSGIYGGKFATSSLSAEAIIDAPNEELVSLLEKHGPNGPLDRSLDYWWVENARVLSKALIAHPLRIKEVSKAVLSNRSLYPYIEYIISSLTEIIKDQILGANDAQASEPPAGRLRISIDLAEILEIFYSLSSQETIDKAGTIAGDALRVSIFRFISVVIHALSEAERIGVLEVLNNLLRSLPEEEHSEESEESGDLIHKTLNTLLDNSVESCANVLKVAPNCQVAREWIKKSAHSNLQTSRAAVAYHLKAVGNQESDFVFSLYDSWTQARDLPILEIGALSLPLFFGRDPSRSVDLAIQWAQLEFKEKGKGSSTFPIKPSHFSLTSNIMGLLMEALTRGYNVAPALEKLTESSTDDFADFCMWHSVRPLVHCLCFVRSNPLLRLLSKIAHHKNPTLTNHLLEHIALRGRNEAEEFPACHDEFLQSVIQILSAESFEPAEANQYSLLRFVEESLQHRPEESLEILQRLTTRGPRNKSIGDLQSIAKMSITLYLQVPSLRQKTNEVLTYCLDHGWDGTSELTALGRR